MKKIAFNVILQNEPGEQHKRLIFAIDEAAACNRAPERARIALSRTLKDRLYGRYEVIACEPASRSSETSTCR